MNLYGYVRVSSIDQNEARQISLYIFYLKSNSPVYLNISIIKRK